MRILGIESSCDETAAAIVESREGKGGVLLGHALYSQVSEHRRYGGVVPEIAARAHLDRLDRLIALCIAEAGIGFDALDGIAATAGPGLIGGVMVGVTMAKAIALVRGLPFVAVNHLEAHALSARMIEPVAFPFLLLLVSGGHCQLLHVAGVGRYRRLGTTVDDAVGEAFDKSAKLLGLGYPGGPAIEAAAALGNRGRFSLPRPMLGRPGCDFSFSGLKTAVRLAAERVGPGDHQAHADLAAAVQDAIADILADRTRNALRMVNSSYEGISSLVVAGGVAANIALRRRLSELAEENGLRAYYPPVALCTDNGAMVAWAGVERLRVGLADELDFPCRPRWPLDAMAVAA